MLHPIASYLSAARVAGRMRTPRTRRERARGTRPCWSSPVVSPALCAAAAHAVRGDPSPRRCRWRRQSRPWHCGRRSDSTRSRTRSPSPSNSSSHPPGSEPLRSLSDREWSQSTYRGGIWVQHEELWIWILRVFLEWPIINKRRRKEEKYVNCASPKHYAYIISIVFDHYMLKKLTWGIKFCSNSTVAGQYHIIHYVFSHPREVELGSYLEFSVYWLPLLAKRLSLLVLGIIGSYIPLATLLFQTNPLCAWHTCYKCLHFTQWQAHACPFTQSSTCNTQAMQTGAVTFEFITATSIDYYPICTNRNMGIVWIEAVSWLACCAVLLMWSPGYCWTAR